MPNDSSLFPICIPYSLSNCFSPLVFSARFSFSLGACVFLAAHVGKLSSAQFFTARESLSRFVESARALSSRERARSRVRSRAGPPFQFDDITREGQGSETKGPSLWANVSPSLLAFGRRQVNSPPLCSRFRFNVVGANRANDGIVTIALTLSDALGRSQY